MGRSFQK